MEPDAQVRSPPPRPTDTSIETKSRPRDPYRDERRGQDRRRRPRSRSRSPVQIDRYQPDRARDDYYRGPPRGRRRSSPPPPLGIDRYVPGEDAAIRHIPVNPIRDPLYEASQVGFTYFAEWWKSEQEVKDAKEYQRTGRRPEPPRETRDEQRARIQTAYDEYKLAHNARMAKIFVATHKQDNWFRERYDPEVRAPLRRQLAEYRRSLHDIWERDMDAGNLDELNMEGIYKGESNGAGGHTEKEEGETSGAAEVLAVSDLLPAKGADLKDPAAALPTLLIKTITPAISRTTLEDFCKEHLGEGEGGFKWLGLSDPNPGKKFHRLGWIVLKEGSGVANGRRTSGAGDDGSGEDNMEISVADNAQTQDKALAAIDNKSIKDAEKGDFTVHVGIHRPTETPRKKALWDLFSAPERIEKDLILAIRLVAKLDQEMGLESATFKIEERVADLAAKGKLRPAAASSKNGKDGDLDMEEGEEQEQEVEVDDEEMMIKKKKLDLLVEYLRRVHNFCFFCVFETDSVHELQRKCMGGHLRRPRASLTSAAREVAMASAAGQPFPASIAGGENGDDSGSPSDERKPGKQHGKLQLQKAFSWVKTFEDKIHQILEPNNADLKKLGGQPIEEALDEELNKYVKQEEESKYRCKVPDCIKLFRDTTFWRKHVEKRHTEWLDKIKEDLELVNRYVLDPSRLAQGRNDANSNGHFPINTSMNSTPRNFTLNGSMMGNGIVPGMFNPMLQYPPGVGPPWPMPGMNGGVGPMRTGMRGPGARPGPYDRRGPPRGGGRSPPRGLPPGGRNSFVEGGVGTFSSQAVEGRTMKSYNDLDAAGGSSGGAALDY